MNKCDHPTPLSGQGVAYDKDWDGLIESGDDVIIQCQHGAWMNRNDMDGKMITFVETECDAPPTVEPYDNYECITSE